MGQKWLRLFLANFFAHIGTASSSSSGDKEKDGLDELSKKLLEGKTKQKDSGAVFSTATLQVAQIFERYLGGTLIR